MGIDTARETVPHYLSSILHTIRLKQRSSLGYPVGPVTLFEDDELKVSYVRSKEGGAYVYLPVVDLVKTCESRSPVGLFVWIDGIRKFGYYDRDADRLYAIGNTPQTVAEDMYRFIHLQWEPDGICAAVDPAHPGAVRPDNRAHERELENRCLNRTAGPVRFDVTTRKGRMLKRNSRVVKAMRAHKLHHIVNAVFYSPLVILPFLLKGAVERSIIFRTVSRDLIPGSAPLLCAGLYFLFLFLWAAMNEVHDLGRPKKRTWVSIVLSGLSFLAAVAMWFLV